MIGDKSNSLSISFERVVMYYEWSYDGDPIIILELEGQILYEYWHIILGITVIGVVSVVVVVVVVKKLRAR